MIEISIVVMGAALFTFALGATALNWIFPMAGARLLRSMLRRKAGLVQKEIRVHGQLVPYLVGGSGEPLILVHGFTANKDAFSAVARYLTPHYTVYSLDLPGHGNAGRDRGADFNSQALVDYVRHFTHCLGLKRVHLGGNSIGAALVALYAARFPDEVLSLWLIGCVATREYWTDLPMIKHYDATGQFPYLVQTHAEHARKMEIVFGKPVSMPHCMHVAFAKAAIGDFAIQTQMFRAIRHTAPIESVYNNLATPALIVVGDQDALVPVSSAQTLAQVFPNSVIQIMQGAGHIPMVERPGQTARDYLQFRAKLSMRK